MYCQSLDVVINHVPSLANETTHNLKTIRSKTLSRVKNLYSLFSCDHHIKSKWVDKESFY